MVPTRRMRRPTGASRRRAHGLRLVVRALGIIGLETVHQLGVAGGPCRGLGKFGAAMAAACGVVLTGRHVRHACRQGQGIEGCVLVKIVEVLIHG